MRYAVRMKRAAILAVFLSVAACGGEPAATETAESVPPRETEPEAPRGGRLVDGYYLADGAPDPVACAADADCTYGAVLAENGCCWSFRDVNAAPMSVAYRDWGLAQRESCDATACPSPPVPTQPPDCLFTVRCAEGRCANECP